MSSFKELLDGQITDPLLQNLAIARAMATICDKLDNDAGVTDTDYLETLEGVTI